MIADITVSDGEVVTFSPTVTDPDVGDILTYSYSGWMTVSSYTTTTLDVGVHVVTVTVSDGELTDTQDVTVTVLSGNQVPVMELVGDITVVEGEVVTLSPTATDPDVGDTLAYSYSGWMTVSSYTTTTLDVGVHVVTVTVSDGELTDTQDVTVTVSSRNQAPVLDVIADITVSDGEVVTFSPTVTDPDVGDILTYSYSGWMTVSSYTTTTLDVGVHVVTVTVSDGELTDTQDVTVTVLSGNQSPVMDLIGDIAVVEGEVVTLSPTATDPDVGDTLTYSYSGWMTVSSYTTTTLDVGVHVVTVTVSDAELTDAQDVQVTVTLGNQPPVLDPISDMTVIEGETVTLSPTATDPDGDTLTFSYLVDGTISMPEIINLATTSEDVGVCVVTVTVSDGELTDAQDVQVTVLSGNQPPVLELITDITAVEGEVVTLSTIATDPDVGDTLTYSYSGWMTVSSYTNNLR